MASMSDQSKTVAQLPDGYPAHELVAGLIQILYSDPHCKANYFAKLKQLYLKFSQPSLIKVGDRSEEDLSSVPKSQEKVGEEISIKLKS